MVCQVACLGFGVVIPIQSNARHDSTLAGRMVVLLSRIVAVCALPLEIPGKPRLPACYVCGVWRLRLLLNGGLTNIRTASVLLRCWSGKMPLANRCAVLRLLERPSGCDPGFHVVLSGFRVMRRCLARVPGETGRIH